MNEEIRRMIPDAEVFISEGCFINELSNTDTDPEVSIARARVLPGVTTRWHCLTGTAERYVIISGIGRMEVGDLAPQDVGPGDVVLIPPGSRQRIANTGGSDLIFLAICTPRFQPKAYKDFDQIDGGYQFLENIATGYWCSQVLFSSLELELFTLIEDGPASISELAAKTQFKQEGLLRLLRVLERLKLVTCSDGVWMNAPSADRHLVVGKPGYMGDFFLYRLYMQPKWLTLTERVRGWTTQVEDLNYRERNLRYVQAMDSLARQKAKEIDEILHGWELSGPILDVGGGAGSLLRALCGIENGRRTALNGQLFDIPEVIEAARELYPDAESWKGITATPGDFRSHCFDHRYGTILLSNFLHTYGPLEAKELIHKAVLLLEDKGIILIHDYFPDRLGAVPEKGALYDLCMMLNTYNGVCHDAHSLCAWLRETGMERITIKDLTTDTSIILAGGQAKFHLANIS